MAPFEVVILLYLYHKVEINATTYWQQFAFKSIFTVKSVADVLISVFGRTGMLFHIVSIHINLANL